MNFIIFFQLDAVEAERDALQEEIEGYSEKVRPYTGTICLMFYITNYLKMIKFFVRYILVYFIFLNCFSFSP